MWQAAKSIRVAVLAIGVVLAWSAAGISPTFAQRGGGPGGGPGGGGRPGGGPGGATHGPGISRGGSAGGGGGSFSRGGSNFSPGGVPRGGASHGSPHYDPYPGPPRHDGGHPSRSSSFYFYPYGYGYRYSTPGLSIYLGTPLYRPYDYYYDYYTVPSYRLYSPPPVTVYRTENTPYVTSSSTVGPVIPASGTAAEYQRQAEQAFRERRYDDAARFSSHAIVEDDQNGKLHLFAAQTFFALGDFRSSAAAIEQAASLLDRSEWGFVVENYQKFYRGNDYVTQTDKLLEFIGANPEASYAYLLLGYHYLFLGHKEAARENLSRAVVLEGRDRLAAELLEMAGGPAAAPLKEVVPTPPPAVEVHPPVATPEVIPPPPPAIDIRPPDAAREVIPPPPPVEKE